MGILRLILKKRLHICGAYATALTGEPEPFLMFSGKAKRNEPRGGT